MKIVDAVKIQDIPRIISLSVMLAYMAVLFIRFIKVYLSVVIVYVLSLTTVLYCYRVRKRVVNRIVHDRKSAVFPRNYRISTAL